MLHCFYFYWELNLLSVFVNQCLFLSSMINNLDISLKKEEEKCAMYKTNKKTYCKINA